ncbi:uncharacterized protein LOC130724363 [Lotus japonicus]|uniref:uncharacterized protein LOC130724363 n=1 Tax=Lotus japonicus TaxID=34305 RepID=UPI00258B9F5D|nr:uncharacterized protein LOC130724363 [Lotus japonicus]
MGLLGKSFTSKFGSITTLAISRIAILMNQHKARASHARSDVAQFLNLGYQDRALLRVEQWIAEQNRLDAFGMIASYCHFLRERAEVLENNRYLKTMECPFELKEATSSLIFASSRCGEFPELHKIREILTSKFGKAFADHAVELRKNNGVNSKMIQKLSPRRLDMEIKMKALKEIATKIGVTLHLKQGPSLISEDKLEFERRLDEVGTSKWSSVDDPKHEANIQRDPENLIQNKDLSDRVASGKVHVHPKGCSSSKQEDVVISKSSRGIDLKHLEWTEIKKQLALWQEESHLELVSKERLEQDTNRESIMLAKQIGS